MYNVYCEKCGLLKGCFKTEGQRHCPVCNSLLKYKETTTTEIKQIMSMSRDEKNQFIENISGHPIDLNYKNDLLDYEIKIHNKNQSRLNNNSKISCPYCQSTDTKKISATARWFSTGLFGLGSKKLGKQWHCNSCGSDF